MATITNGDYVTSPIPNATMLEKLKDGSLYAYAIKAVDGYVLHDSRIDEAEFDPETFEPTGNMTPRFKTGSTTVPKNYDFDTTIEGTYQTNQGEIIEVNKIGEYEFYTIPNDKDGETK